MVYCDAATAAAATAAAATADAPVTAAAGSAPAHCSFNELLILHPHFVLCEPAVLLKDRGQVPPLQLAQAGHYSA
eukprot:11974-Heterococcus_DN1.PRE.3